jgi:hypothetical protein
MGETAAVVAPRTAEVPMVEQEVVRRIRMLAEADWGHKRIAREVGVARNTVRRYLRAGSAADKQVRPKARRLTGPSSSTRWSCGMERRRATPSSSRCCWPRREWRPACAPCNERWRTEDCSTPSCPDARTPEPTRPCWSPSAPGGPGSGGAEAVPHGDAQALGAREARHQYVMTLLIRLAQPGVEGSCRSGRIFRHVVAGHARGQAAEW